MLNKIFNFIKRSKISNLKNSLIKGAIGSFALKIAGTFLTFVRSIMFARLLGTEGLGIYVYAITWASLLSIPAKLGLPQLIVREVAVYEAKSDWSLMRGLLRYCDIAVLIVSIGLASIAGGVSWRLHLHSGEQMFLVLCIAIISLPLTSLTNLKLSTLKGFRQVVIAQLPMIIAPLLLISLTGFAHLFLKIHLSASWVVAIDILVTSIIFGISTLLLQAKLPESFNNAVAQYQPGKWLSSALPMMFLGAMQIINSQTDILMLGALKGASSVGVYVVINRLASLIIFVLMSVSSVIAPNIARLYAQEKFEELQILVTRSSQGILLVSLPIAVCLIGFGDKILLLFGSDFTQEQYALNILIFGQLVNALTGTVGLLLTMTGYEKFTVINVGISALLNILLNALLIPHWQVMGAATATAISTINRNILNFIWVKKKLGINSLAFGK